MEVFHLVEQEVPLQVHQEVLVVMELQIEVVEVQVEQEVLVICMVETVVQV
jgi:hypothetical protein